MPSGRAVERLVGRHDAVGGGDVDDAAAPCARPSRAPSTWQQRNVPVTLTSQRRAPSARAGSPRSATRRRRAAASTLSLMAALLTSTSMRPQRAQHRVAQAPATDSRSVMSAAQPSASTPCSREPRRRSAAQAAPSRSATTTCAPGARPGPGSAARPRRPSAPVTTADLARRARRRRGRSRSVAPRRARGLVWKLRGAAEDRLHRLAAQARAPTSLAASASRSSGSTSR